MKLCKDCKHYISGGDYMRDLCALTSYVDDVVRGTPSHRDCPEVRRDESACGIDAKWFAAKPEQVLDSAKIKMERVHNAIQNLWSIKHHMPRLASEIILGLAIELDVPIKD